MCEQRHRISSDNVSQNLLPRIEEVRWLPSACWEHQARSRRRRHLAYSKRPRPSKLSVL
ncbi:hypothetical protein BAUCODRAFT_359696 [Baudoinia panamericana UAMH 10762]|uniref:Uncharacterized protein n=1 Tax=Baudoinia panamericana (strain UAMH 10762) TaxID=717646 RepID=M2N7E8_BAUPA|nr:uncharacterized protein BAUCODRAFT_359696 [Baudoinia panamericana UAMH 10762]EMD00009.1 hypothetical protein BAUCODRAFT_359696 [Baudoinia panamericana UAMH 10762]